MFLLLLKLLILALTCQNLAYYRLQPPSPRLAVALLFIACRI